MKPWTLPTKQLRLYMYMILKTGQNGLFKEAKTVIAKDLGYASTKSVRDLMKSLIDKGYVKEIKGGITVHPHTPRRRGGEIKQYQVITGSIEYSIPHTIKKCGVPTQYSRRASQSYTMRMSRLQSRKDDG